MKQDRLFESGAVSEDFSFNDQVAEVFDDMLNRSIPFYAQVIDCMAAILREKGRPGTTVYDLGCATGTTLLELARRLPDLNFRFVGIDNAPAMLAKARRKAEMFSRSPLVHFLEDDITRAHLPDGGAVLCNYTLQFIRPLARPHFVRRLYETLPPGGLLLVSEKVISHDPMLNRVYIDLYHQFKLRQGYSELEIAAKREALENILIPFSIRENRDLLTLAGFSTVETFFQWFNFASFIAVK
ncbi:MAG TPA: carboxy-S-adenosyl-L-methionine synthase CmoA [Desulfobulbaceae bacterium]|nr:carboxy-S-adenosyl-L-methionine synthase CmoA [Desulfobulbaceae bacterium]